MKQKVRIEYYTGVCIYAGYEAAWSSHTFRWPSVPVKDGYVAVGSSNAYLIEKTGGWSWLEDGPQEKIVPVSEIEIVSKIKKIRGVWREIE